MKLLTKYKYFFFNVIQLKVYLNLLYIHKQRINPKLKTMNSNLLHHHFLLSSPLSNFTHILPYHFSQDIRSLLAIEMIHDNDKKFSQRAPPSSDTID